MARTDIEGQKALKLALDKIEKDYGKGTVISSSLKAEKVDVISTGSLGLDLATGIGGIARGKITELIGWESSGKSTIMLHTIAEAQKLGLKCILVDGEQSFDVKYARNLGINIDDLYIVQLGSGGGEACYNIAESLVKTGEIGLCIFDSQTSLLPKKVLDGEVGDSAMGLHARMMSQCVPKMMNTTAYGNCATIYISQFREKIGVMFGSPETTNGGNALKFYAHTRVEVRKSILKEEDVAIANKTKCKVIKNKLAAPYGTCEFRINFGTGIDREREILELAVEKEVIKKSGSWYSKGEDRLGQGENAMIQLFHNNPTFAEEIEHELMNILKPINSEVVSTHQMQVSSSPITLVE